MIASVAGAVLIEAGIQHPVQGVLDAPVGATVTANRAAPSVAEER
jgi:hypothetical protein